jgi:hypothetical protein
MSLSTAPRRGARPGLYVPATAVLAAAGALALGARSGAEPVVPWAAVQVISDGQAAALAARLPDQNGRPGGFEPSGGQPTVVFVVSAARLKRLKAWESALRQRFEGLRFVRVADVPPARPPARYEDVARRLRERVPRDVSVLIDVDRLWATGFEIDSRQVNVLVLDAAGRLAGQLAGDPTPERLAQAVALVRPLAPPSAAPGAPR